MTVTAASTLAVGDADATIRAVAERLARGDATALVDLLELRGGTVRTISVGAAG